MEINRETVIDDNNNEVDFVIFTDKNNDILSKQGPYHKDSIIECIYDEITYVVYPCTNADPNGRVFVDFKSMKKRINKN